MKTAAKLFYFIAAFFLPVGLLYGFWSEWKEPMGVTTLLLCSGMALMIAFYVSRTEKQLPANRPDDDPSGMIEDAEGDYGFFSPGSWWPLWLALAASVCFAGLAIGWWVFALGAVMGVWALFGWVFEYFKGEHAL
ncbi:MAG: cytochrome c oxidase subunit 4 [Micrococcales bacterium]|nr:cytochrome c oxidase subunit 4 [Micrococcales bacterium]